MFFFKSYDKRFILKTMNNDDLEQMINSLQSFFIHFDNNPASLIARVLGVYTIKMDKFTPQHVFIMENCLPKISRYEIMHIFDIKGSEFSRKVLKDEKEQR